MRIGAGVISIPGMGGAPPLLTPADLSAGAALRFHSVAEADNVTLSGSDVDQWSALSGSNHYTGATPDPIWAATGWDDGSPEIQLDGTGHCFENNNYNASGNSHWALVVVDIVSTAIGFIYSVGGSGGGFGWGQGGAYFIFDAAYRTVGTAVTGKQVLLFIADATAAEGADPTTPKGVIYKDGTSLGALSADYDGTMNVGGGGYPVLGANTTTGAVDPICNVKAVAFGEGTLTADDVAILNAWGASF